MKLWKELGAKERRKNLREKLKLKPVRALENANAEKNCQKLLNKSFLKFGK